MSSASLSEDSQIDNFTQFQNLYNLLSVQKRAGQKFSNCEMCILIKIYLLVVKSVNGVNGAGLKCIFYPTFDFRKRG